MCTHLIIYICKLNMYIFINVFTNIDACPHTQKHTHVHMHEYIYMPHHMSLGALGCQEVWTARAVAAVQELVHAKSLGSHVF